MRIIAECAPNPAILPPFELSILGAGLDLSQRGQLEFHGYAIAKEMREREAAPALSWAGHTLSGLETGWKGPHLLESRHEDPEVAAAESRPRRRLYKVTAQGETAYAATSPAPRTERHAPERPSNRHEYGFCIGHSWGSFPG